MTGILAIDTATDACTVALWRDGQLDERFELAPRRHNQLLFQMLQDILPDGQLRQQGIDAIAYGSGPGSFTGLRIAASAVQGLAFASGLPAIPVSTLAAQAQAAFRLGLAAEGGTVFSALDARIKEIYHASFQMVNGLASQRTKASACAPGAVDLEVDAAVVVGVGSGCEFSAQFPLAVRDCMGSVHPELVPRAQDLIPQALDELGRGRTQSASQVQPVYVRDEISWKKLADQGKQA